MESSLAVESHIITRLEIHAFTSIKLVYYCWPLTLHVNPLAEFPFGKFNIERSQLYEKMAAELDEKGPAFLGDGKTSQSLKVHIIASIYVLTNKSLDTIVCE